MPIENIVEEVEDIVEEVVEISEDLGLIDETEANYILTQVRAYKRIILFAIPIVAILVVIFQS